MFRAVARISGVGLFRRGEELWTRGELGIFRDETANEGGCILTWQALDMSEAAGEATNVMAGGWMVGLFITLRGANGLG